MNECLVNCSLEFEPVVETLGLPVWSGFIFLATSSLFWGSIYVPIKQIDCGDGLFFQSVAVYGLWPVGFIINAIRHFPPFYPAPLIGGLLMSLGQLTSIWAVNLNGVGPSVCVWSVTSFLNGWLTARFGWFGLKSDIPANQVYNYIGLGLATLSAIPYALIKAETKYHADFKLIFCLKRDKASKESKKAVKINKPKSKKDRILGIVFALFTGIMFGQCFTPMIAIGQSENKRIYMDYMFSYYSSITICSLIYFAIYCAIKHNRPIVQPNLLLPAVLSGILWGLGDTAYLLAISVLSPTVTIPIGFCGPQIVSNLWGSLVFGEIRGKRNIAFLIAGFSLILIASVFIGLSS